MIRFHCPLCDKTLKAPEQKAGATVLCPRCKERCVVPLTADGSDGRAAESGAWGRSAAHAHGDEAPPLFPAMTRGGRWVVGVAAGAAVLSLLLAVTVPFVPVLAAAADAARSAAMILTPCCTVAVLAVLYGAATGCPSCNRWWTRRPAEKEFVDREVFEKDGEPFARSIYRTNYECTACRHRWSATSADEYKEFVRHDRTRQRLG
jgi:hypothetical protein